MSTETAPDATIERTDQRLPASRALKSMLDLLAALAVSPLAGWLHLWVRLAPGRSDTTIQGLSQLVALVPGVPGVFIRRALFRMTLKECARESSIGFGTIIATPDVRIGEGVSIGPFCNIGHAAIGSDTLLGSNVTLLAGTRQHGIGRLDVPMRFQRGKYQRIVVGRDVWIGNGAIVAADVGDQAIIGAGAVVVKPVPARAIVAGNPARVIGERGRSDGVE